MAPQQQAEAESHHRAARLYQRLGDGQWGDEADPSEAYASAIDCARASLALEPERPFTLQVLADSLSALGEEQHRRGQDPSDAYAQALDAYERGIALQPGDGGLWNGRCITYRLLGEWLSEHGADAADAFERSVASAEETIRHSRDLRGHHSRALAYLGRAVWAVRRGQPPTTKWVEHTLEFHDEMVTRTPNSAEAGWLRARRFEAVRRWRDGLAALAQALLDSPDQPAAGELAERINRTRADAPRAWFK